MFPLSSTLELTQATSLSLALVIHLGFGFPFYDRVVTQAWLHQSGILFFEPPPEASLFAPTRPIPSSGDDARGF